MEVFVVIRRDSTESSFTRSTKSRTVYVPSTIVDLQLIVLLIILCKLFINILRNCFGTSVYRLQYPHTPMLRFWLLLTTVHMSRVQNIHGPTVAWRRITYKSSYASSLFRRWLKKIVSFVTCLRSGIKIQQALGKKNLHPFTTLL